MAEGPYQFILGCQKFSSSINSGPPSEGCLFIALAMLRTCSRELPLLVESISPSLIPSIVEGPGIHHSLPRLGDMGHGLACIINSGISHIA